MTKTTTLGIAPASPRTHGGMTVFPLLSLDPVELPYRTLSDAIADGSVVITEVTDGGSVPELLAVNEGSGTVLVLDGEQLIGAKQNRMASRSFLLPPKTETKIPVSCVEQGRWRYRSGTFAHAPYHSPSALREKLRAHERRMASEGREVTPDSLSDAQGAVWREVDAYGQALQVRSATSALHDLHGSVRPGIDDLAEAFPAEEGQVGLLAFRGSRLLGLDLIGGRSLYADFHDRLVRGYAFDVMAARSGPERSDATRCDADRSDADRSDPKREEPETPDEGRALRFLDRLQRAKRTPVPTVGGGTYLVLSETVMGAELLDGDRIAHRSAFEPESDVRGGGPIVRRRL